MKVDPMYHSPDISTKKYFRSLWTGMMNANSWNPFAFVDRTDNNIIYVKKSATYNGSVDLDYEGYSE